MSYATISADGGVAVEPSVISKGAYGSVPAAPSDFAALSGGAPGHVAAAAPGGLFSGFTSPSSSALFGLTAKGKIAVVLGFAAIVAISVGVTLGLVLGSAPVVDDGCSYTQYRLANVASPSNYSVLWKPQFVEPFLLTAATEIGVTITRAGQRCLQVHAYQNLNFSSVMVASAGGAPAAAPWVRSPVAENERIIVTLPRIFDVGESLTLAFAYSAPLTGDLVGLYLSTYVDDSNATVTLASTQFEATFARRAFPCFDEPAYKANFTLTLDGIPAGYTALGNMPEAAAPTLNGDGTTKVTFLPTPKMSTYLVAAVIAPLINVSGVAGRNNVAVSVWAVARASNAYQIEYALNCGLVVLDYYEATFGVAFPLPAIRMVAIPDFAAGAMENWGLITCVVTGGAGIIILCAR